MITFEYNGEKENLHEIIFYRDRNGSSPVLSYMKTLERGQSKDSRIKFNKLNDYIQMLSVYGVAKLSKNYVKHLDGDIWDLRPIRDRILFAGVVGGQYVLLHQFVKRTEKTPRREIEKAKRELADFKERSGLK